MLKAILTSLMALSLFSCVHLDSKPDEAPFLQADDTVAELTEAGIQFGGRTLEKAMKILDYQKNWPRAGVLVRSQLIEDSIDWSVTEMANATRLYERSGDPSAHEVFEFLSASESRLLRELGWHVASILPSRSMQRVIDRRMAQHIEDDELGKLIIPQVARAIVANKLVSSYSVLKLGLMNQGDPIWAESMITMRPLKASHDFMDYLALASAEDLRQISIPNINVVTSSAILAHLRSFPVESSHPKFSHLILYSISRNLGLADLAREVLLGYLPVHRKSIAMHLARFPSWVQMAFLEGHRKKLTSNMNLLLSELKGVTVQKHVIEEIDLIQR